MGARHAESGGPPIRASTVSIRCLANRGYSRRFPEEEILTSRQAIAFVRRHGVVLEAARGPVPSLAEAVAGERIRGNWWGHPLGHEIFALTRVLRSSDDILVCRVVDGKITYVDRRLWPSLVRLATRFPRHRLAQVHEVHTAFGRHVTKEVPFPKWVPPTVSAEASGLTEEMAASRLGSWCT